MGWRKSCRRMNQFHSRCVPRSNGGERGRDGDGDGDGKTTNFYNPPECHLPSSLIRRVGTMHIATFLHHQIHTVGEFGIEESFTIIPFIGGC